MKHAPVRLLIITGALLAPIVLWESAHGSWWSPENCAEWAQATGMHGPRINGVDPGWRCEDQPGGGIRLYSRGLL